VALIGSQKFAARIAGRSVSSLKRYTAGAELPVNVAVKLAREARVLLEWLCTGMGPMRREPDPSVAIARKTESLPDRDIPQDALPSMAVVGLAECGIKGWYQEGAMAVRAARPGDLQDPDAFAVIATGYSMQPAGILNGFLCFCSPRDRYSAGDAVFIETVDRRASIKMVRSEESDWLHLQGWLDPDERGHQEPYEEKLRRDQVRRVATVIYVKRKL
jgi:phage repressor protein C with HTH and peptisase S24 domain